MAGIGDAVGGRQAGTCGGGGGGAVIALLRSAAGRGGGAMTPDPGLEQVRAYWEALRARVGDVPPRSSVGPRGIETALDRSFLIERIAPGHARFRLAGRRLCDLMGMEVAGMPLSALIVPGDRAQLSEILEAVFATPALADLLLAAPRSLGRPAIMGRMLLLPLRGLSGATDRALGCLAVEGAPGRSPRRLTLISRQLETLDADPGPLSGNAGHPAALPPVTASGLAEGAADFAPAPPPRGRPQLRVIRGDLD